MPLLMVRNSGSLIEHLLWHMKPEAGGGGVDDTCCLHTDTDHANFGLRVEPAPVEGPQCMLRALWGYGRRGIPGCTS
eukprot:2581135-Amphidinium_carterae.4